MAADRLTQRFAKVERQRKVKRARRGDGRRDGDAGRPTAVPFRINDLTRLYKHHWGTRPLPDDDAGRDDAWIMVRHLAILCRDDPQRITRWLQTWAPWMPAEESETMIARALTVKWLWTADTLGKRLNLSKTDRDALKIRTIGDIETTSAQRRARRQENAKLRAEAHRRARGARPQAQSLNRTEPWKELGMSRATWYRAGKPTA